ncbi:hypothetical protein M422DRAFT_262806 [Sphaerobolus stellatus SS14]|uniref:Acyl-CoA dehydrogenase/oxidase C-terminal domain-containing protein n=1 Tax=Sphaerobolus stellatus (strain SS14) TaxID=990650 RepID=A0A0C9TX85_SPHS4|nr:hypothetical protein M422DRAFT_262806 [Sphaerobolus stellatus SS14]
MFGIIVLLGKVECGVATPGEVARLCLLTPVVKAYSAQKATGAMEEAMVAPGGLGYMEEMGIERLIHDSMVEKIWHCRLVNIFQTGK